MSNWWIVLIVVLLAAAGFLYLRSRRERHEDVVVGVASDRDYEQEREASRVTQMSTEDRAWEAASLQKNREAQEQKPPLPPAN